MKLTVLMAAGAVLVLASAAAEAQTPAPPAAPPAAAAKSTSVGGPPLALAREAADAAIAACRREGSAISVVVMDDKGVIKLVEAADGARAGQWTTAQRKATASLATGMDGVPLFDKFNADKAFADKVNADPTGIYVRPGARLIRGGDGRAIGVMGISGSVSLAPAGPIGGVRDDACAAIGLKKIASRLK
ncbi:MAG: heme-binding protein [Caulobacteraceae bacterium]